MIIHVQPTQINETETHKSDRDNKRLCLHGQIDINKVYKFVISIYELM